MNVMPITTACTIGPPNSLILRLSQKSSHSASEQ